MSFGKTLTIVGAVLLLLAWSLASGIPAAAHKDFDVLVKDNGGHLSHTAAFPDEFKKLSAHRRFLQNFYIGAAGLVCLAIGLNEYRREVRNVTNESDDESELPE